MWNLKHKPEDTDCKVVVVEDGGRRRMGILCFVSLNKLNKKLFLEVYPTLYNHDERM